MAYVFGFSREVTELINSYWDWRYRLVRGGGKTPSASTMPLPVPPHAGYEPVTKNMEHGKSYIQRIEHTCDAWGRGPRAASCEHQYMGIAHAPQLGLRSSSSPANQEL